MGRKGKQREGRRKGESDDIKVKQVVFDSYLASRLQGLPFKWSTDDICYKLFSLLFLLNGWNYELQWSVPFIASQGFFLSGVRENVWVFHVSLTQPCIANFGYLLRRSSAWKPAFGVCCPSLANISYHCICYEVMRASTLEASSWRGTPTPRMKSTIEYARWNASEEIEFTTEPWCDWGKRLWTQWHRRGKGVLQLCPLLYLSCF